MWTSYRPQEYTNFLRIHTSSGHNITATHGHFIFSQKLPNGMDTLDTTTTPVATLADWNYVTVSDLNIGDYLLVSNIRVGGGVVPSRITSIETTTGKGVYNPRTRNGAIIVNGVVASEQTAFVLKWAAGNAFHSGLLKTLKIGILIVPRCFDAPVAGFIARVAGHSTSDAMVNRDVFRSSCSASALGVGIQKNSISRV
ncbi:hypothetical protein Ndes2526B_g09267 [Nannochloris sp. 'desiccata']